jgi:hypothetical protein
MVDSPQIDLAAIVEVRPAQKQESLASASAFTCKNAHKWGSKHQYWALLFSFLSQILMAQCFVPFRGVA